MGLLDRDDLIVVLEDENEPAARRILHGIGLILREIRMTQAQLDADRDQIIAATQAIADGVTAVDTELSTGVSAIQAEIATLVAASPVPLDTSGVDAAVAALTAGTSSALADLKSGADAVAAIPPAATTPPPVLAPQPVYTVDGDTNTDTANFSTAPFTTNDSPARPLFFFAGDTAGGPATGDGQDGTYHVYTGTLLAV